MSFPNRIDVTKTLLPPLEEYVELLKGVWQRGWITNNGELVQALENSLKKKLEIPNLLFTANGTIVLDMALRALDVTKEVITTPFSYVATTNALLWRNIKPVFADINKDTFCIDPNKIVELISENTEAILATHVFGLPCDVEAIEAIAKAHKLPVIYDAAHAFGTVYKNKSLLAYGDVSTCSFHATKLFHTAEGGCITARDKAVAEKLFYYRQFGHLFDDYRSEGVNAKNSELHAAMGICNLPRVPGFIENRKAVTAVYDHYLLGKLQRPAIPEHTIYNYGYYAVAFPDKGTMMHVYESLQEENVFCRRYFFPSLNTLNFLAYQPCPVSESIAERVLCLPLFNGMETGMAETIAQLILKKL